MSKKLNVVLALACGLILANLYYAQPLISAISESLGLNEAAGGLIVTLAQSGYVLGILLIVPLGDKLENRGLIRFLIFGSSLALLLVGLASPKVVVMPAFFLLGLFTSVVQLIIPYGVSLAAEDQRGQAIGLIASGAILGIVLSRPVAGFLTGWFTWRACFLISGGLLVVVGIFFRRLPVKDAPPAAQPYLTVLSSMAGMIKSNRLLRRKIGAMALVFSGFSLFWSAAPLYLNTKLGFSHPEVALVSLTSLAAPVCTILAGRLADRGLGFITAAIGMAAASIGFLLTPIFGAQAVLFVLSVLLLDCDTHTASLVTQQSVITIDAQARSRLNALYMAGMFGGGALGSAVGPWLFSHYGWGAAAWAGFALSVFGLAFHISQKLSKTKKCLN